MTNPETTESTQVHQLMTREVARCTPQDSLHDVVRRMQEDDCGCLPVVDSEDHLVGMVTDRDICLAAFKHHSALGHLQVKEAMTPSPVAVGADDPVRNAERVMRQHQVRRVPVVGEHERVVGILSLHDLARAAAAGDGPVGAQELSRTLAAIGEPR